MESKRVEIREYTLEELNEMLKENLAWAAANPEIQRELKEMGERISRPLGWSRGPLVWDPEDDDAPNLGELYGNIPETPELTDEDWNKAKLDIKDIEEAGE